MSLRLDGEGTDAGVEIKTHGMRALPGVYLTISRVGTVIISLEDFLTAAEYVLTNTDIEGSGDPRLAWLERVRKMELVAGFSAPEDPNSFRLDVNPAKEPSPVSLPPHLPATDGSTNCGGL